MSDPQSPLIEATGIVKRYGDVTVLDHIDCQIQRGEIHAILGANGAGKSTLVRILAGLTPRTSGKMRIDGQAFDPNNKQAAEAAGIEIVQQELNLIPTLNVAENLRLNRLPNRCGVIAGGKLHKSARKALDRFGLQDIDTQTTVGSLGVGRQQMIEIAAALDRKCKLLILDEPTAALSSGESEQLFKWLNKLRDEGVAIIYITHRLQEVMRLADRVSILRDGRHVGSWSIDELNPDEMVRQMGGDVEATLRGEQKEFDDAEVALRVENLSGAGFRNASLKVRKGERLGIAGLVGSGRTELLRAIFGADPVGAGNIYRGLSEQPLRIRHPADAVKAGIAMLTEDRKENGLLLTQSIRFNTTLASLWKRFCRLGLIRQQLETTTAEAMRQKLDTRCESIEQAIATLSGGNQQKVAVAKWLVRDADVFLLDEPTRGIDVAARRRLHDLIQTLAQQCKAVIIVSSDLEELLETCDTIAVMSRGELVASFKRPDWSESQIMQAAFSRYVQSA